MKRLVLYGFMCATIVAVAVLTLLPSSSQGSSITTQPSPRPGGSRGNCNPDLATCNDVHDVTLYLGDTTQAPSFNVTLSGGMTLRCYDTGTTTDGKWWWKQDVTRFEGTGTETTLGTVHVFLDSSRTSTQAYMVSNVAGDEWPKRHDVYAYAKLTISAFPGVVYRSINQFHMYNTAITSFAQTGTQTTYDVASTVNFEDSANPGVVVFSVPPTPTTVIP
jgi:hypothetical protein